MQTELISTSKEKHCWWRKFWDAVWLLSEEWEWFESLWNSLPLEDKSSASYPNFMNRLKSYCHVGKHSTLHILGVVW